MMEDRIPFYWAQGLVPMGTHVSGIWLSYWKIASVSCI